MKRTFFLIGTALLGLGAPAEARTITFKGGVLYGLRAEIPEDGQPASAGYFLPGLAVQKPVSAARRAKIDEALTDARRAYETDKSSAYRDHPGQRGPDESFEHFGGRLVTQCKVEEPFHLEQNRERIGVNCGGRITQFFMVSFTGDEIAEFDVDEARVPNLAKAKGDDR